MVCPWNCTEDCCGHTVEGLGVGLKDRQSQIVQWNFTLGSYWIKFVLYSRDSVGSVAISKVSLEWQENGDLTQTYRSFYQTYKFKPSTSNHKDVIKSF